MHPSKIFLILCCAIILGVVVASWLIVSDAMLWSLVVASGVLLLARRLWLSIVAVAILACAFGMWRTQNVLNEQSIVWSLAQSKPVVALNGYVDGDFETTATGGRYTFHVLQIITDTKTVDTDDRVLVSGPDWIRPRQGQWLILKGKLQQPKNFADFDYIGYLAKDDIRGTMYFPTYDVPIVENASRILRLEVWSAGKLASLRLALKDAIVQAVPEPEAGFLTGILVGAKGNISAGLKNAFARTGTSHIVALSGYNITILVTVLMMLLAPLGTRRAYIVAVVGVVLFVIFVGAGASVVRAAIMGILAITAQRFGRLSDATMSIAVTAVAMLLYNPLILRWDVGFQLSFLAFAGIVYVQPLLEPLVVRLVRYKTLASLIATTLSAQIAVLPLLLHVFGIFAVYTLPVNMLVLPLVPTAMALGFATAIAGVLWPWAGAFVGQLAWLVSALQLSIIGFFSQLPYAALTINLSTPLMLSLYVLLTTWLVSKRSSLRPLELTTSRSSQTHTLANQ